MMPPIHFVIVAFPCTVGAIVLAMLHIYRHLLNYTEPTYQRYIVRIIFMVPVCCSPILAYLFCHQNEGRERGIVPKKKKKGRVRGPNLFLVVVVVVWLTHLLNLHSFLIVMLYYIVEEIEKSLFL